MFEGFAVLSANIKTQLNDGFPMLMEGLVGMLWLRLLEPVPGTRIVAFASRPGSLHGSQTTGKGTKAPTVTVAASILRH